MFDDSEQPDSLLGVVEVPLLPLAHGNNISGVFEISNKTLGGGVVGVMSLKLEWQMSYLPPSAQPDILTPDQTDRRYAACDLDTGQFFGFTFTFIYIFIYVLFDIHLHFLTFC